MHGSAAYGIRSISTLTVIASAVGKVVADELKKGVTKSIKSTSTINAIGNSDSNDMDAEDDNDEDDVEFQTTQDSAASNANNTNRSSLSSRHNSTSTLMVSSLKLLINDLSTKLSIFNHW
jgi:hypothetical protein